MSGTLGATTYYPRDDELEAFVNSLAAETRSAIKRKDGNLADVHNAFANYTVSLLFFATGHRPVVDPFCYRSQFDTRGGMCLISDKVISEDRAYRLCALPSLAVKQLHAYEEHLKSLIRKLEIKNKKEESTNYTDVCTLIASLLDPSVSDSSLLVPFFFHLPSDLSAPQNFVPASLEKVWERFLDIPLNFGRHALATGLRQQGVPADMRLLQLGHQDTLEHPLGPLSPVVPERDLKSLGQEIDRLLEGLGWEVIPGLRLRGSYYSKSMRNRSKALVHKNLDFGPQMRARSRAERKEMRRSILRRAVEKTFPHSGKEPITSEIIVNFIEAIRDTADEQGVSVNACLRVAYTWLMSKSAPQLHKDVRIRLQAVVDPEPSPANANTLREYNGLRDPRERYLTLLRSRAEQIDPIGFGLEERLAEIILAAALLDGVRHPAGYKAMAKALLTKTYALDDLVFVELESDKRRSSRDPFRWYPGHLSKALITGLYQYLGTNPSSTHNARALLTVLSAMIKELGGRLDRNDKIDTVLERWVKSSRLIESPGLVRSAVDGSVRFRTLPLSALVRLLTGKRLAEPAAISDDSEKMSEIVPTWIPPMGRRFTDAKVQTERRFIPRYSKLRKEVAEEAKIQGRLGQRRWLKKTLAEKIRNVITDEPWPERVQLLGAWIVELCENGTRGKRDIAYSTVEDYSLAVGVPLLELNVDSFLGLSDVELEEFYLRVLDYRGSRKKKGDLAGRLREFHSFLEDAFGVGEPDWSVIYQASGRNEPPGISANLICPWEYENALNLILRDVELDERKRDQYAFLLFTGYRFGARFGEAFRIQWRSVQHDPQANELWLQIRNNIFGTVKTESSIRQTPLIGSLTEVERGLLTRVMATGGEDAKIDPATGFMHQSGNTREPIDRSAAALYLNGLLREVTGDPSSRFHHARHTWAMQRFATAMEPVDEGGAWGRIREAITDGGRYTGGEHALWGARAADTRYLRGISSALGHLSSETTMTSYIHITDAYASEFSQNHIKIHDAILSYALGITPATLRQRRSRKGEDTQQSLRFLLLPSKKQIGLPEPEDPVTDEKPDTASLPHTGIRAEVSLPKIERILSIVARRNGDKNGIAQYMHMTEEDLNEVLDAADSVERLSGLGKYKMLLSGTEPLLQEERENMEPPYESRFGVRRLRVLLHKLDRHLEQLTPDQRLRVAQSMDAWMRAFRLGKRSPIFSGLNDAETFLRGCEQLCLEISWKGFCPSKTLGAVKAWADHWGIPCQKEDGRLRPHEKQLRRKRAWLRLAPAAVPKMVGAVDTLNRCFFMLSVWTTLDLRALRTRQISLSDPGKVQT